MTSVSRPVLSADVLADAQLESFKLLKGLGAIQTDTIQDLVNVFSK